MPRATKMVRMIFSFIAFLFQGSIIWFFGSVLICLRWVRRCRGARRCRSTAATKSGHYQRRSSFDRDTIQLVSIQIEMHSAVTISLIPEARGAPFVFWDDLAAGCEKAA